MADLRDSPKVHCGYHLLTSLMGKLDVTVLDTQAKLLPCCLSSHDGCEMPPNVAYGRPLCSPGHLHPCVNPNLCCLAWFDGSPLNRISYRVFCQADCAACYIQNMLNPDYNHSKRRAWCPVCTNVAMIGIDGSQGFYTVSFKSTVKRGSGGNDPAHGNMTYTVETQGLVCSPECGKILQRVWHGATLSMEHHSVN